MSAVTHGPIVLLGSGETLPSSGKTHEFVAQRLPKNPRIAILETPAGFEPNSDVVAGKIKSYLERRLQNYNPTIEIVSARKQGTPYSPNNPEIVAPILKADEILLGPGSPTYGVRQLKDSLAVEMIVARQRRGGMLFLSSSATLAFGAFTLPVYEIFKVGEDLHWKPGVDYFKQFGLSLSIVSHWNNNDGGDELDTSRCYMGKMRYRELEKMLPPGQTIVGIDEHTSIILDFKEACCHVRGHDKITILQDGNVREFPTGTSFPLDVLGEWHIPSGPEGIAPSVWEAALNAEAEREAELKIKPKPSAELIALSEARREARSDQKWALADALRDQILSLGWQIKDTPEGSELFLLDED